MEKGINTCTIDIEGKNANFRRLSLSLACMRFPLAVTIIFYHSYTIVSIPDCHFYFKSIYPFSLWLGETGVPAFFFISGLWFFYSKKTYQEKIQNRIKSLLAPYFLWNTIMLATFIVAFLLGYNHMINKIKYIAEYGLIDYIRAYWDCGDWAYGNGKPVYPPMWFVRDLFLLCLISPVIKVIIKKTNFIFPLAAILFWLFFPGFWLIPESIMAFCAGAYFPLCNKNPMNFLDKHKNLVIGSMILLGIADVITNTLYYIPFNLQIHRLAILTNIISIPIIGEFFIKHQLYMKSLSNMAFFIYCIHLPIVALFRKPVLWHPHLSNGIHIMLYFSTVLLVTIITIHIYKIAKMIWPSFIRIATGNRE